MLEESIEMKRESGLCRNHAVVKLSRHADNIWQLSSEYPNETATDELAVLSEKK